MPRPQAIGDLVRRGRQVLRHPVTRAVVALVGVVAGGATVMLTMAVGHCGFMGGLCPADPVPWWQDDVFGSAATGLALAAVTPLLAWRPNRRGLAFAAVAVVVVVMPVAWLLTEVLRTGST
jgi:hypothetical protein